MHGTGTLQFAVKTPPAVSGILRNGRGWGGLQRHSPGPMVAGRAPTKCSIFDRFYKGFCSLVNAMEKIQFYQGFTRVWGRILDQLEGINMTAFQFGAGFHRG